MAGALPRLGVGLGYRAPYLGDLFLAPGAVDFLEISADHFFDAPPEKLEELDLLAAHFPLIPHGLDLNLCGADEIDPIYLDAFAVLIDRIRPAWWSEHLAFTRAGGIAVGHLTPPPFTQEAIDVFARNVETVRRRISVPLILENVTEPFPTPPAEMSEAQFVSRALAAADCGWLCDVANLHANAVNSGRRAAEDWDDWPWARLTQMHFAGGRFIEGAYVDTHDAPTAPEVWRLLEAALARADVKGIILERDENLPPFADLAAEVARARECYARAA